MVFVQEHSQLLLAHHQIFIGKLVGDVPSDWPELTPILHDCVEEAEAKEKLLELLSLLAFGELLLFHVLVGSKQVVTQA